MAYVEGELPTVVQGNGSNNGLWGGDGLLALVVLFALFGFGGNGFGFGGNGTNALASDSAFISRALESGFNSLERKGDYIQEQVCNQTDTMLTGFSNVNTNIMQTGYGLQNALNDMNVAQLQRSFAEQTATTQGFTNVIAGQSQARYDSAINTCNLQHSMCQNTRDIIDSQTAGTRAILDRLTNDELSRKQETIDMLRARNSALELSASQQAQNAYLVSRLAPTPQPSYTVPNPYTGYYGGYGYGYYGNGGTTIQ